jgi:hypothetical protein
MGYDVVGIVEVLDSEQDQYTQAAQIGENTTFNSIISNTGRRDRMLIIYDSIRFELLNQQELTTIQHLMKCLMILIGFGFIQEI